ncbi:TetR/AcrR family transcriptional regulator [Nocardia cyriacigeorgica]|uniref:TetR/AcrR family transcriptional regulator n=1 Tax=Nocardia cyriacigeorgica TaxID=135487 RepID=A0A6P1DCD8_9NOCA|nr:TetR/AcrR family transcriptional regulator [Nocardia cyriacigeorgica]NEW39840.1 TetR/AcrR family transcriptional regulator [Nocardia cyriacigeorgica]NEW46303.1 TetR/AcrR family transcriptional regulator [Nocardia cyriacigeorgica]NEW52475.1 TetR/AcrR family transcriptional regulator [Nocardia cyriacigeorgica]NEW58462.1 TetR/AcrR family transcriptional regulator [Nocardia cyriacigeorgica]
MTQSSWSVREARERSDTDRHRALLDAAARVFDARGYDNTTVADITAEAGVSRATLYVYFASKDEIFLALAARTRDSFLAAQEPELPDDDPRTMLRATFESVAAAVLDAGPLLRLIDERGAVDPRVAGIAAEITDRPIRRFTRYLDRETRAGRIRPVASAHVIAETLSYAITYGILSRRDGDPLAQASYLDDLGKMADKLLGLGC